MKNIIFLFVSSAILNLTATPIFAQKASFDPTRPPTASEVVPTASNSGAGGGLQSVILPKHGKPFAIIDGQRVTVGDHVGDAKVTKITESAVTLKGPEGIRTIKMSPNVEKTPSVKRRQATTEGGGR